MTSQTGTPQPAAPLHFIATGGAFSGQRTDRGYVPAPASEQIGRLLAACGHGGDARIREVDPPFDSADATPSTWQTLVEAVDQTVSGPVVIIHGTDTMAYAASALAFARPQRRIIFTGAQVPLSYEGSDAEENLHHAVTTALTEQTPGTYIAFAGHMIPATRATKDSTITGEGYRNARYSPGRPLRETTPPPLNFTAFRDLEVPVLHIYPGISTTTATAVLQQATTAAVLNCYGAGHAPAATPGFLDALRQATHKGLAIVAVSQAIDGGCQLGTSQNSQDLVEAGVIDGGDMTVEAALAKLHYLMGCNLPAQYLRKLVTIDLAGELQPRAPQQGGTAPGFVDSLT